MKKHTLISVIVVIILFGAIVFFASKNSFSKDANLGQVRGGVEGAAKLQELNKDQLIAVINCLVGPGGLGLQKCIAQVLATPVLDSVLTVTMAPNPIRSTNNQIKVPGGASGVPMVNFNVKSEVGRSVIKTVTVMASGTRPSTVSLYDGITLLGTRTVSATSAAITFDNLNHIVEKDVSKTLVVKGDYYTSSSTITGSPLASSGMLTVDSVAWQKPAGQTITASAQIWGAPQYFYYPNVAQFKLQSTPVIVTQGTTASGSHQGLVANFAITESVSGASMPIPTSADIVIAFRNNATGTKIMTASSSITATPIITSIPDGTSVIVNVSAYLPSNMIPTSGLYTANVESIAWRYSANNRVVQTYGLEDFKTPTAANFRK